MAEIILGIDPGSRKTGYGVIKTQGSALVYLGSGCINAGSGALYKRLVRLFLLRYLQLLSNFRRQFLLLKKLFI